MNRLWPECLSGSPGDEIGMDICIEADGEVACFQLDLQISDPTRFQFIEAVPGPLAPSNGWEMFGFFQLSPDLIRVAGYTVYPGQFITGTGKFITLRLQVLNNGTTNGSQQTIINPLNDIAEFEHIRKGLFYFRSPKGDVNQDGVVTAGDAQLAFQIALGMYTPSIEEKAAADFDSDGVVTAGDSQSIFRKALGII